MSTHGAAQGLEQGFGQQHMEREEIRTLMQSYCKIKRGRSFYSGRGAGGRPRLLVVYNSCYSGSMFAKLNIGNKEVAMLDFGAKSLELMKEKLDSFLE